MSAGWLRAATISALVGAVLGAAGCLLFGVSGEWVGPTVWLSSFACGVEGAIAWQERHR